MADPLIVRIYSGQEGKDLPYFVGGGIQVGGSGWLRTAGRFSFPIVKRLLKVAENTAEDVLMKDKNALSSLGSNALTELGNFVSGKGVKQRKPRKKRKKMNDNRRHRRFLIPPLFSQIKRASKTVKR